MTGPDSLLDDVVQTVKARRFAGRRVPAEVADAPAYSTAAALEVAAQALATQQDLEVAAVSLDDDHVSIVGYQAGAAVSVGLGHGHDIARAYHIALQTPIERVAQWAPEEPIPQALRLSALNRSAHPAAVAASSMELQLSHAVWMAAARQALRASEDGRSPLNHEALDLVVPHGTRRAHRRPAGTGRAVAREHPGAGRRHATGARSGIEPGHARRAGPHRRSGCLRVGPRPVGRMRRSARPRESRRAGRAG